MPNKKHQLLAKPVVKNKFWVVEKDGEKVATIQAHPDGVSYVRGEDREKFPSVKLLGAKYNIKFEPVTYQKKVKPTFNVYGYPTETKAYHTLWEVSRNLPIYTKSAKSKSYYCAGHYLIKFESHWALSYCPKLITLNRYQFLGPFLTKQIAQEQLKLQHE